MVAIVSGNGLGLLNSSAGVLGQLGMAGAASQGSSKEAAYLNIFNGNLSLSDSDDFLAAHGVNVALTRTYNAQGNFNTGNGASWQYGLSRQVVLESGVANAAGSSVIRTAGDGSSTRYTYDTVKKAYTSTDGGGATQSITYNAATNEWTWRAERNDQLGTQEIYDGNNGGRLSSIRDLVGVRQIFQYNAAGRLSQITDATGASGIAGSADNDQTYFDYDANGNLSQIRHRLASGATFTRAHYSYDSLNRLQTVSIDLTPEDNNIGDGQVYTTSYSYDGSSNRIASVNQSDGTVLRVGYKQYGADWKVSSYTDGLGRTTTLDYSVPGRTTVTDPLGQTSSYAYDSQGRLTSISSPSPVAAAAALVTQFYYDTAGNVSRMVDARGLETVYGYDANGNRILERDAQGNTITRVYNLITNQLQAEARFLTPDPDGAGAGAAALPATTRYIYDANNRLHYALSPEGRITEFRYNALGEVSSELHYAGLYSVASLGALVVPTEAQLNTAVAATTMDKTKLQRIDYTYDARGLRASATRYASTSASGDGVADGSQSVQRYVYDQAGNLLTTYDGNNNPLTTTYDGLGRKLLQTDALGNSVLNTYDRSANLSVVTRDAGNRLINSVTYVRDAAGQLTSVSQTYDQQSGSSSYTYDANGQLRVSTSVSGQRTYWLYDNAGRKVAQIEHNGALTEFVYNADGQVTRTIRYAGTVDTSRLANGAGQPLNVTLADLRPAAGPNDRSSWNSYDKAGRLSASVDANGYLTRYAYDGASRLVQTTYRALAIDTSKLDGQSIADSYTGEASSDDRVTRNLYDLDNNLVGQLDAAGYLTESIYDAAGRLTTTVLYANPTAAAQRPAGALASLRPAANAADIRQRNFYDGKGLLVATLDGDGYLNEMRYDAAGQVVLRTRYAAAVTTPAAATLELLGKKVSAEDRMMLYSYDADGRLLRETTLGGSFKQYRYDGAGNLIAVTTGAGSTADRTSQTRYDGAGHVLAQLTPEGAARLAALGADPASASVEAVWAAYAVHYSYNAAGQRLSATDAMGNRTLYFYDDMGRASATVGADGSVLQQRYDQDGLLLQSVRYAKQLSSAQLAALSGGADSALAPTLAQLANASLDRRNVYYYDNSGRLVYTVNADGEVSGQSYTAFGQVAQTVRYSAGYSGAALQGLNGGRGAVALSELAGIPNSDSNARTLAYYDANGRLLYSVNAMGEVSGQTYNAAGQVQTSSQYGARIALSTLTGANTDTTKLAALAGKASTTYLYDHRGNVVDVSDALLNHTLSSYNGFGELAKVTQLSTAGSLATAALDLSLRTLYDPSGRVLATIDASGALTLNRYDAAGRLSETIHYANRLAAADATAASAVTVADLGAKLASSTDQRVRYAYDDAGRPVAVATLQRVGATEEWSVVRQRYDANGNLLERIAYATALQRTDPAAADILAVAASTSDAVTQYRYDQLNRVVATAVAQYLATNGQTAWGVSTVSYDAMCNVASRTQYANMAYGNSPLEPLNTAVYANPAVDRTSRYSYDALNRLRYTIDAVGGVTGIVYDSLGRPAQTTQYATVSQLAGPIGNDYVPASSPLDRISRTIYDLAGRPVYQIDALGAVTENRYNAYGKLSAQVAYATPLSPSARAGLSAATSVTDLKALLTLNSTDDRSTRYYYDLAGQLRFKVDAAGYIQETQYNALGQVTRSAVYLTPKPTLTEASTLADLTAAAVQSGRLTSYTYDAQGNLLTVIDPINAKQSYTYDALGNKTSFTNALGKTWTYKYDATGRNIEETSPTVSAYADIGVTAVSNWVSTPTVLVTTLTYDALGNLTSRTEGAGSAQPRTTGYGYDRVGRQTETRLPATQVYDAAAPAGADGRTERSVSGTIRVFYDALGNAVINQDAGGVVSQKSYDQQGRVAFDIDALGYATGYDRNAFGEVTTLTRYNSPQSLRAWDGADANRKALVKDASSDRSVVTTYDVRGQALTVTEPATAIYDGRALGSSYVTAARTTANSYNGFGELIQQQVYGADANGVRVTDAASTRYDYDLRGLKIVQINALSDSAQLRSGYLTTYEYDDAGHVLRQIDYAAAITFTDNGSYTLTATNTGDKLNRQNVHEYDRNGNLITEIEVGATYTDANGNAGVTNLYTRYTYDALGRQTSMNNKLGQISNTYYDELGRISAVSRQLTATTAQLTEFKRDQYGNALLRIDHAMAASTASGGSVAVAPTAINPNDPNNHITYTRYDAQGRAIATLDPEQYARGAAGKPMYSSYDIYGHLARQWRSVTDNGQQYTAFQLYGYDALGRQTWVQTPGNLNLLTNSTGPDSRKVQVYNAFGEVTETHLLIPATGQDSLLSQSRYDRAGHAWLSNASDGIDTIYLYDAQGNTTAQIRSTSTDPARAHELLNLPNAMAALTLAGQQRIENQYDLLGRVVDSRQVSERSSVLRWTDSGWALATPLYNESLADSLVIIGQREDAGKGFGVQYRLRGSSDWINANGSRIQWVNGYPVFSTGGLASGDYEYQVTTQPTGEPVYVSGSGTLRIVATDSSDKDAKVVALYMLLLGRTPSAPELNYWVNAYNQGATLTSIAGDMYVGDEAKTYRANNNANAVRQLFQTSGLPLPTDDDYSSELTLWTMRLNEAGSSAAALGQVTGLLVFRRLPAVALRAVAVTNYLVRGGTDQTVVNNLLAHADSAADGAIAEGTRAAQLESQRRQLARLYIGLFGRAPDKAGFDFWAASLAAGTDTIETVALSMLKGAEANDATLLPTTLSASQYNDKLVRLAYANLLGRAPTDTELATALAGLGNPPSAAHAKLLVTLAARVAGELNDGVAVDPVARNILFNKTTVALAYAAMPSQGVDQAQMIVINKAVIAGMSTADTAAAAAHQATLWLTTQQLAATAAVTASAAAAGATPLETLRLQLARLYAVALNRAPDVNGFNFWLAQLKANGSKVLVSIVGDMLAKEGSNAALYPPSLSDRDFITRVFTMGMGLQPGSTTLDNAVGAWIPQAAGKTRAELMLAIINSVVQSNNGWDQPMRNLLNNKAAVGVTYAVNFAGSDLNQEKAILQLVTDSDITAALQYGNTSAVQIAADAALATSIAAKAAATQAGTIVSAVQGIVTAQGQVTTAQKAADANPLAAPVLRAAQLYVSLLQRGTPGYPGLDLGGLTNMAQQMAAGATDVQMAQSILDSAEGQRLFPTSGYNSAQFITQLYRQMLGREPDAAGLAFWTAAAPTLASRAQIVVDMLKSFLTDPVADSNPNKYANQLAQAQFYDKMNAALTGLSADATSAATALAAAVAASTDADNKAKAAATATKAVDTAATNAAATNARKVLEVSRLFVGILNRGPSKPIEIAGLNFWTRARLENVTLESIANDFLISDEGKQLFAGATSNQAFINQIYQQVLGRLPAAGDNFWLSALNSGASRGKIAADIITSVTEQTFQAESEYLIKASFDQRVADAMKATAATATAGATAAASDLSAKLTEKNRTATVLSNAQKALTAANALTVDNDANVKAAVAAAPRGAAYLAAADVKAVTELLVAFNRPADFNTVYALVTGSLHGDDLLKSIIKPLVTTPLTDRNAFFTALYQSILQRAPETAGLTWWVNATAAVTDPASIALDFYKAALKELYAPVAGVTVRTGYTAQFNATNNANLSQASSMANGVAPARALAAAQIAQQQSNAQADYTNAGIAASQADTAWQFATSFNNVAKVALTALNSAGTVQTAQVAADKAMAATFAANALLPGVAASVGLPVGTTTADYTARAAVASNVQKALVLDGTLEVAQAALARANATRTSAVQDTSGVTPLSQQVATITQIYTAVLNRAPTLLEINLSLGQLKFGKTTDDLAAALIAGNLSLYPATMTNDAFVTKIYTQAMGRAPDTKGLRFWSDALNGAGGLTRGALVLSMIRSMTVENINSDSLTFNTRVTGYLNTLSTQALDASTPAKATTNLADFIAANTATARLEATNFDAAAAAALPAAGQYVTELTQLYISILGRSPEPTALLSAIAQRSAGTTLAAIAQSIVTSQEASQRFAAGSTDTQFINDFYKLGLGRSPDPAEVTAALALLAGGKNTRGQLVISLIKDLYAYNGNDAIKVAVRTTFMAKVSTSLERSTNELDAYRATMAAAVARSTDMEKVAIVSRSADGTVLGRDSTTSDRASQGTARTTLDRWGNVLSVSDSRDGNWKISYTYDYNNNLLSKTANALVGSTSVPTVKNQYDALGRLVATTDGRGYTNRQAYDVAGNIVTETHADTGTVINTYDLFGNRLTMTQARGSGLAAQMTRYSYDHLSHMTASWSDAAVVSYAADSHHTRDLVATAQTAAQLMQFYSYDELGRNVTRTDAAGVTSYIRYDVDGNVIQNTDTGGRTTIYAFDQFHNRVAMQDALGNGMRWTSDSFGRLLSSSSLAIATGSNAANTIITNYAYDAAGQKIAQTASNGQNIQYTYDQGLLTQIRDAATGVTTTYTYDQAGNRLTERQNYAAGFSSPTRVQNNVMTYDMQNRLTKVVDDMYTLSYGYDANGNRTSVTTQVAGTANPLVMYNTFDSMNRQLIVNGTSTDNGKTITLGDNGHALSYDFIGNRMTDRFKGVKVITSGSSYSTQTGVGVETTESYAYDGAGRLIEIKRDGVVVNQRHYDKDGRVAESGILYASSMGNLAGVVDAVGFSSTKHTYAYNIGGQLLEQRDERYNSNGGIGDLIQNFYFLDNEGHYDAVGNLLNYTISPKDHGPWENFNYFVTYVYINGEYKEQTKRVDRGATNVSNYDVNGNRTSLVEQGNGTPLSTLWYDADGHVLSRRDNGSEERFSLVVNGQVLGDETKTANPLLGSTYTGVSTPALNAPPASYSVQSAGETLQSIANNLWGDSKLWYLIADANGLNSDAKLAAGQILAIPMRVNTVHNDYATYKPYDAAEAMGDTSPAAPPPSSHGGGCGGAGKFIMAVVAIAVTAYTGGLLAGFASQGFGAALAAGAAAGAAGSVASQMVGIAIGAQDGFSWKGVAMAAVAGGVSNGIGSLADAGSLTDALKVKDFPSLAARAALSNAVTQSVSIMAGLQSGFDWRGVAAAGAGAYATAYVGSNLSGTSFFADNTLALNTAANFAGGISSSIMRGGKLDMVSIATDAFGNALGSSLADSMQRTPVTPVKSFSDSIDRGPDWYQDWKAKTQDMSIAEIADIDFSSEAESVGSPHEQKKTRTQEEIDYANDWVDKQKGKWNIDDKFQGTEAVKRGLVNVVRDGNTLSLNANVLVGSDDPALARDYAKASQDFWGGKSFTDTDGTVYRTNVRVGVAEDRSKATIWLDKTLAPKSDVTTDWRNSEQNFPTSGLYGKPSLVYPHEFAHVAFGVWDAYGNVTFPDGRAMQGVPRIGFEDSIMANTISGKLRFSDLKGIMLHLEKSQYTLRRGK